MTFLDVILAFAALVVALGCLGVVAWLFYAAWLRRVERGLSQRKGLYRATVAGLAQRERILLEPEILQLRTLHDFEALEALLEEQARNLVDRPAWLLDAYDRLGLVEKYVARLRTAREWRERAFAAELLGRVGNAKAVPALIETIQATRTEDADVREIALRALARIGDPRAVESLVDALKHAESWLAPRIADILARHGEAVVEPMMAFLQDGTRHPARAWAANVLGELKVARAFPALVAALKDSDDEVRAKSASALGKVGDRRAVTYLLDHLLSDPAPFVRARIAGALGQFGDHEVIDRLVRALGDPAWWVRMRSVEALEQIGPSAEAPLTVALDDPDPEIRLRAAVGLERLGVPTRLVAEIARGAATPETETMLTKFGLAGARELLAEHLLHRDLRVRRAIITTIQRADRKDLAPELMERAAHDPEAVLRAEALAGLQAMGVREAIPVALEALGDGNERVRAAATDLLGELGGRELSGVLEPRASDGDPLVRAAAARALGLVGAAHAEREFARLLRDPETVVRIAAADGAAAAGWKGAVPRVIELLDDLEEPVRIAAARALGQLGDPSAVTPLLRSFTDATGELSYAICDAIAHLDSGALERVIAVLLERGDAIGRARVVRTIAGLRETQPVGLLQALFRDPSADVRTAAAEALGRAPGPETPALLESGLTDPDERVRQAAVDGLVRLHHHGAGPGILNSLREDSSPLVRERAALATGLFRTPGGESALLRACRSEEPLAVRAAALLALGAYDQESLVARVLAMGDEAEVRDTLRERLRQDAEYRLLGLRLRDARHVELRALGSSSREQMEQSLAEGMRGVLSPDQRIRLVAGLRAFQGQRSRTALLSVIRSDPDPGVRAAALTAVGDMLDPEELYLTATRALADPNRGVRHAAVALFQRVAPERGLPGLMRLLRAETDPVVLRAIAEQAEAAFPAFLDLALGLDRAGPEAVLLARVARYMLHPDLKLALAVVGLSQAPAVRLAVAELWEHRPELIEPAALEALAVDPAVEVRQAAVGAWRAARQFTRLSQMVADPDPGVRQRVARAFLDAPDSEVIEPLFLDPDPEVRAALAATRLVRGEWNDSAAGYGIPRAALQAALRELVPLETLREQAQDREPERRLAAALCLAVLQDEVAHTVLRTDPRRNIREAVSRMLEAWRDPPDVRHSA